MAPSETLWRPGPAEPTSTWRRRRPARSSSSTLAGSAFGSENATTRSLTGGFGTRPWSASVSTGGSSAAAAATEVTWSVCEPGFVTCTVSTWFAPTTVDVKRSVSGDRTMLGAAVTVIVAGTSSTGCTGSFVETTSVLSYVPWDRVPTSAV